MEPTTIIMCLITRFLSSAAGSFVGRELHRKWEEYKNQEKVLLIELEQKERNLKTELIDANEFVEHHFKKLKTVLSKLVQNSADSKESAEKSCKRLLDEVLAQVISERIENTIETAYAKLDAEQTKKGHFRYLTEWGYNPHYSFSCSYQKNKSRIPSGDSTVDTFPVNSENYTQYTHVQKIKLVDVTLVNDSLRGKLSQIFNDPDLEDADATDLTEPLRQRVREIFKKKNKVWDCVKELNNDLYDMSHWLESPYLEEETSDDSRASYITKLQEKIIQTTNNLETLEKEALDSVNSLAVILAKDTVSDEIRSAANEGLLLTASDLFGFPVRKECKLNFPPENPTTLHITFKDWEEALSLLNLASPSLKSCRDTPVKLAFFPPALPLHATTTLIDKDSPAPFPKVSLQMSWEGSRSVLRDPSYDHPSRGRYSKYYPVKVSELNQYGPHYETLKLAPSPESPDQGVIMYNYDGGGVSEIQDLAQREFDVYRRGEQSLESLRDALLGSPRIRSERIKKLFQIFNASDEDQTEILLRCKEIYSINYRCCQKVTEKINELEKNEHARYVWLYNNQFAVESPRWITEKQAAALLKELFVQ